MPEIKFKLVDGEPVCPCDENVCSHYVYYDGPRCNLVCCGAEMGFEPNDETGEYPCWPGVRQQRDEARREICEGIAARDRTMGPYECGLTKERNAKKRGWSYLYEGVK